MNKWMVGLIICVLCVVGGVCIYNYTTTPKEDPMIAKLLEYPCIKYGSKDVTNDVGIKDKNTDVGYYFKGDKDERVYIKYGKHTMYVYYKDIDPELESKLKKLKLTISEKKDGTLRVTYAGEELEEWVKHK